MVFGVQTEKVISTVDEFAAIVVLLHVEGVVNGGKNYIMEETRTSLDRLCVQFGGFKRKK